VRQSKVSSTFCEVLSSRAARAGNKQAFVFLNSGGAVEDELTFGALDLRARALAAKLIEGDLGGKRALLVFPPGLDFVVALFACFYAGVVAVPVPFFSGRRVVERINSIGRDANPIGLLTLARLATEPQLREAAFAKAHDFVWIFTDSIGAEREALDVLPMISPEALAMLQYTSGSTSNPKGVMLSHANLMANSAMIADLFGHDETSRGVGWLPLFHDMGLVGHVLQPVYFGGLSVLMSPLAFLQKPVRWLQAISNWQATTSGGPTHAFELCLRSVRDEETETIDLSSWQIAYCGSEKIRPDILDRFVKRFSANGFRRQSLLPCFGLAEATLLVTGAPRGSKLTTEFPDSSILNSASAMSCGEPARNSSVVIVDQDTKRKVPDGCVGEIWIQGPHVAQGYWGVSGHENDEQFDARLADGAGPYLRTGDLGFMRAGQLFVTGRIKDTIIINGVKHSAEDIEACMCGHQVFAGCAGAAFGIDFNGHECAVLIQEVRRGRLDSDELAQAVSSGFASITRQLGLRLFDIVLVKEGALARTSSGKVRRAHAREKYLAKGFEPLTTVHAVLPTVEGSFTSIV
jgi:acyl-CoA synthetase (AMP-forming)/AMP-acid ligase II